MELRILIAVAAMAAQAAAAQTPPPAAVAAPAARQQSGGRAAAAATPAPIPAAALPGATSPQQKQQDELQMAIIKRDNARVATMIRAGVLLNFNFSDINRGRTDESPLTLSINRGHLDIARLLLEGGADPNRPDGAGRTPMQQARSAEATRLLVQAGANTNIADRSGRTAIASAVERGDLQTLDALIANGGRLDAKGDDLLARAIDSRQPQMIRPLLERGLDVRAVPTQAVLRLIESGDEDTAKLLLQRGADPNARGPYGEPLLVRALFRQRWNLAEALVDAGAELKLADPPDCARAAFGCLSIQLARMSSFNPQVLAKLVDKGLDLNAVAASGHTALSSLIVEQTFAIRAVAAGSQTAVAHNAVTGETVVRNMPVIQPVREIPAPDNVARATALLVRGANPNVKYRDGTPLMLALSDPAKPRAFADVLLDHGGRIEFESTIPKPDPERPNFVATTGSAAAPGSNLVFNNQGVLTGMNIGPLTWALTRNRPDVVLRLLAKGEQVGRADRHLLYFAAAFGHADAIPELVRHTREVNVSDRADVTPLMFAASAGHAGAVRALLAAGARVNTRSDADWPPLLERSVYHYIGGHSPSRPPLVGGYTALRAARERGHADVVRILSEAGGRD